MKVLLFLLLIFFSQPFTAQVTYYKLHSYELENTLEDIELNNNQIYISALGLAKTDTNLYSLITNLSKINLDNGKEIKTVPKSNLLPFYYDKNSFNRLSKFGNNFIVSGHEVSITQETKFHIFNSDLEDQREFSITSANAERIGNEGIYVDDSILYSYGLLLKNEVLFANILKYNLNTNTIIWDKNYEKGKRFNQMWDFQKTHDGNFVFIMYHKDADAGSGSNSGYQIVKIDPDGTIIDTFSHSDSGDDKQRILASREGAIYYTTKDNPFSPNIPTNGRINKLSENMDTIPWSLELPSNAFTNGNMYEIFDYIQANNGDIMACGKVWHMPGGPLVAGLNATHNGFVARVTQQGELKWSRIYRLPNDNPKLPKDEYGNFRAGQLDKIVETEAGNFVLGGTAFYSSIQLNSGKLQFGDTVTSLWLMVIDENGCIEGEECEAVIHLDYIYRPSQNFAKVLNYNQTWYINDGNTIQRYTYSRDTVWKNGWYYEKLISLYEDGSSAFVEGYYREFDGKVYKKTSATTPETLEMDMALLQGELYYNLDDTLIVIHVDTIQYKDQIERKRIGLACLNDPNNKIVMYWVEGIGVTQVDPGSCISDVELYKLICLSSTNGFIYKASETQNCWNYDPNISASKLVNDKVSWTETKSDFSGQLRNLKYRFSANTILIGNKYYRELLSTNLEEAEPLESTNKYFREDENKIYTRSFNTDEVIIYNFNLNPADTFRTYDEVVNEEIEYIVTETSTITLMNNEIRKLLKLRCINDPTGNIYGYKTWIEGIGDGYGFNSTIYGCYTDWLTILNCHYSNDSLIYMNPVSSGCWTTAIEEIDSPKFLIIPNPSKDKIEIVGNVDFDYGTIYSMYGINLLKKAFNNIIEISELPNGIYIIELEKKGKSLGKQKFVKNDGLK